MASHPTPDDKGSRPVPDPTILTTEQLHREIAALERVMDQRIIAVNNAVDLKVSALENVQDQKFEGIQGQFTEVRRASDAVERDNKTNLAAALQAAKELVGEQRTSTNTAITKTEANTDKRIDQLTLLIQSESKGLNDKIVDLKDRLTRIEAKDVGAKETKSGAIVNVNLLIAIIGLAIVVAAFFMARH